jgi:hypothetical protein
MPVSQLNVIESPSYSLTTDYNIILLTKRLNIDGMQ